MIISTIFANLSWVGWLAAALFYVAIALLVSASLAHHAASELKAPPASNDWIAILWAPSLALSGVLWILTFAIRAIRSPIERARLWGWAAGCEYRQAKRNVRVGGET